MSNTRTGIRAKLVRWVLAAAMAVTSIGVALVPVNAQAVSCHVFSSSKAGGTDWYFYTPIYTVPSSSGCSDINVAAIGTSNHCAYMKVEFFPSSGGSYFGSEKYVCSSSISTVKVLAWDVLNGTRYRIWAAYTNTTLGTSYPFKVID